MWEVNGIKGEGLSPPHVANTCSGILVIMGGAMCVWDDLQAVAALFGQEYKRKWEDWPIPLSYMAVNDIGAHWEGRLQHWATVHPAYMSGWMTFRKGHSFIDGVVAETHSNKPHIAIDHVWQLPLIGGSGGFFACQVALALGYKRVILAGIPMDGTRHFFDPPWHAGGVLGGRPEATVWEQAAREVFADRIKSFSGRTLRWLGPPTIEWIKEEVKI